jgi:hypothetical protein
MAKKIIVKNNRVVGVEIAEFPIHVDTGTWHDCSNDSVKTGWTYNLDGSVTKPEPGIDNRTYKQKRKNDYTIEASYGDVIDALFKKEAGDSSEWDALVTAREAIKILYPKP